MVKSTFCMACGTVGTFIAGALGGWDHAIISLLTFMAIDYVTGLLVAGVFHKSKKTESGGLESRAGFKGLVRKCVILLLVVVANLLDDQIGANYIRNGVCIAFLVNEALSIIENAGLMGIPIPAFITKGIEILKSKEMQ